MHLTWRCGAFHLDCEPHIYMRNTPRSQVMRCLSLLIVFALLWSCSTSTEEIEEQELSIYNDLLDQLAWQSGAMCGRADGLNPKAWSIAYADSVKNALRTQADRRVLYYQPKIGAVHKIAALSDWIAVEMSSWERFYSTFSGTQEKQALPNLTVSSALKADGLKTDYVDIVKLDTAARTAPDSSATVVRFSKPFYHEAMNRAVVYFESTCGKTQARGELLMLRFKEGRWMIEERRAVWVR